MSVQPTGSDLLLELIPEIYDAALDQSLWPSVLNRIGDCVGGPQMLFGVFDPASGLSNMIAPRIDPEQIQSLIEWAPRNPLLPLGAGQSPGAVFTCGDFLTEDEFTRSDFYNDWWKSNGFDTEPLTTNLIVDGDATGILTSHGTVNRPPFRDPQKRMFAELAKHLVRAVAIQRKVHHLKFVNETVLDGLDKLEQGFVLVDEGGRPLFANRTARKMFADADGIRLDKGALAAVHPQDGKVLLALIASCKVAGSLAVGGDVKLRRKEPQLPALAVKVIPAWSRSAPIGQWMGARPPAAIVVMTDPQSERHNHVEQLRLQFGFTNAEAVVALEIAKGDGRQAAADRLGITVGTARTHLSKIFDKTGCRRQSELVRLLSDKG